MSASTARSTARSTLLIGPSGTAWPLVSRKQPGAFFFDFVPDSHSVQWCSGNSLEVLGMPEQALEHGALFLAHVHPSDRFRIEAALESALRGECAYVATYRWIRPDTQEVRMLHCRALLEADGSAMRGFFIDLSSEVALLQNNADAAASVAQSLEQLGLTGVATDIEFRIQSVHIGNNPSALTFGVTDSKPEILKPGQLLYHCFQSEESQERIYSLLVEAFNSPDGVSYEWSGWRSYIIPLMMNGIPQGLCIYTDDVSKEQELLAENTALKAKLALLENAAKTAAYITETSHELMGYAAIVSRHVHGNPIVRHAADNIKSLAAQVGIAAHTLMEPCPIATSPKELSSTTKSLPGANNDPSPSNTKIILASSKTRGASVLGSLLHESGLHVFTSDLAENAVRDAILAHRFVRIVLLDIASNDASAAHLVRALRRLFPALHVICLVPGPVNQFIELQRSGAVLLISKPAGAREIERVIKGLLMLSRVEPHG